MVSNHTSHNVLMPCFLLSKYVQMKNTKTANRRSIMKIVEMRFANIPLIVAIGLVYNRMFPVSTDSARTSTEGAIKPIIARDKKRVFAFIRF